MKKIVCVALVAVLGFGCKKKKPEEGLEPPSAAPLPTTGSAMAAPPPPPLTSEGIAKRLDACWGFWNAGAYGDFKSCYAPDATSEMPGSGMPIATGADAVVEATKQFKAALPDLKGEPQLELVNGHNVAVVARLTGTQTAPMTTPTGTLAPTNKRIGVLIAQSFELDEAGRAKHEADYFDLATMLGQLSPMKDHPVRAALENRTMPKDVVIAKDDATEKSNLAGAKAAVDAFNKHDAKAFGDALADDSVWSEQGDSKDANKKETVAQAQDIWKGFSDLAIKPSASWAAGDYVVTAATLEGTNDAPMPAMGIKAKTGKKIVVPMFVIHKLDKGKIKQTWVFDQTLASATQLGLVPPPAAPAAGSAAK